MSSFFGKTRKLSVRELTGMTPTQIKELSPTAISRKELNKLSVSELNKKFNKKQLQSLAHVKLFKTLIKEGYTRERALEEIKSKIEKRIQEKKKEQEELEKVYEELGLVELSDPKIQDLEKRLKALDEPGLEERLNSLYKGGKSQKRKTYKKKSNKKSQ